MKLNILRGKILSLLKKVYPEGIDGVTIISVLYQYHKTDDILESLEYLADKGYLIKKEEPHMYLKNETFTWYKLTPLGIDLLEGSVPADPGILVQRG